jgi:carbamoyl-phosphate synthase large subunit
MQDTITVLFTSAGRRNQLMQCFREDARRLGLPLRVLAADMDPELSPACHQADARFKVPRCTDGAYVPALLEICQRERVALIVPTIDTELPSLSRSTELFAATGTRILISAPEVIELARDKLSTAERLSAHGVSTPRTLLLKDYLRDPEQLPWPVIAKPKSGSASRGIVVPKNLEQLKELDYNVSYLVQSLWVGAEYTVNVFFDQSGELKCAVPHRRLEVRSGEVSKGRTERVSALIDVARKLPEIIPGARGPLCFQAIVTETGDYAVFEINARFGGGFPLAHRAGARMPQWILEQITGRNPSASDVWQAGVTMLRYDTAVFIE